MVGVLEKHGQVCYVVVMTIKKNELIMDCYVKKYGGCGGYVVRWRLQSNQMMIRQGHI